MSVSLWVPQSITRVVSQSVALFLSQSLPISVSPTLVSPSVNPTVSRSVILYLLCMFVTHSLLQYLPPSFPTSLPATPYRSLTIHTSQKSEPSAGTGTFPAAANNTPGLPSHLQSASQPAS